MSDQNKDAIGSIFGKLSDAEQSVKNEINSLSTLVSGKLNNMLVVALSLIEPFSVVQSSAAAMVKSLGLGNENIIKMSKNLVEANHNLELSTKYGISNKEMMETQARVVGDLGRNALMDMKGADSTLENIMAGAKLVGPEMMSQITTGYDKLGISMKSAGKAVGKLFKEAGEHGINFQLYSKNFASNLAMAQTYTFRNGVDGLKEMARKATEIRQDMQQVARFADKVGTVTGAVETAARLQVLGGSFTAMANPLAMLNESLTDMNGLTEMTKGAATYNSATHQIEIDPFTRMQIKAAAEAAGLDASNLFDQATAQARRGEIENQIRGMGVDDRLKKILLNSGQIDENGVAGVTVGDEFLSVAELMNNPDKVDEFIRQSATQEEDVKLIAENVLSIAEVVTGRKEQLSNEKAYQSVQPGIIGGLSTYDVTRASIGRIGRPQIQAAAKMDEYANNILAHGVNIGSSIMSSFLAAGNASSPQEFGENIGKAFGDIFGPSAENFMKNIGEGAADWVANVSKRLKDEYGIDTLAYNHGEKGSTTSPVTSSTVTGTTVASSTGGSTAAATAGAGTASSSTGAVITGGGSAPGYTFKQNSSTIPTASVETGKNNTVQTGGQTPSARRGDSGPLVIRLDGHISVDVIGDKGNMGSEDILNLILSDKNGKTFKEELAKMISDQIKVMDQKGS